MSNGQGINPGVEISEGIISAQLKLLAGGTEVQGKGESDGTAVVREALPSTIIDGSKNNIGGVATQLIVAATPIKKGILVLCDSLGTAGTYIKFGNATSQSIAALKAVGESVWIDWVDDLSKIRVIGDNTGNNAAVSWNGG